VNITALNMQAEEQAVEKQLQLSHPSQSLSERTEQRVQGAVIMIAGPLAIRFLQVCESTAATRPAPLVCNVCRPSAHR
jgi:hypothetical protein